MEPSLQLSSLRSMLAEMETPLLSPFVAPKLPFLVLRLHLSSLRVSWLTTLYYWQVNNQRASQRHSGEESACNVGDARDAGSIPGSGRFPGRRTWQPTLVFLPVKLHEQRSLVGYTPWGCKESVRHKTEHACKQRNKSLSEQC